jgi:hypothetical protein
MTLVLTCMASEWAVQVSDRRLVRSTGQSTTIVTEEANNAIVYHEKFAIGYTGLARLGGQQTDDWIARQLVQHPTVEAGILGLAEAATAAFKKVLGVPPAFRRHAFVIAGFGFIDKTSGPVPLLFRVSNALDQRGNWLVLPKPAFEVKAERLPPTLPFAIVATGQVLLPETQKWLKRWVGRAVEKNASPAAVARLMARAVWETAAQNKVVGSSLMVVGVVRDEVKGPHSVVANRYPRRDQSTFFYFNRQGRSNPQLGPLVVWPGRMMGNITVKYL